MAASRNGTGATPPTATATVTIRPAVMPTRATASTDGHSAYRLLVARSYAARSCGMGGGRTTAVRISRSPRRSPRDGSVPSPNSAATPRVGPSATSTEAS